MIVISNGKSTRANGYLDRLTGQLDKAGIACAVFDRVEPNPLNSTVNAGGGSPGTRLRFYHRPGRRELHGRRQVHRADRSE